MKNLVFVVLIICSYPCYSQTISDELLQNPWQANWITAPGSSNVNQWNAAYDGGLKDYGVYKFRKTFELSSVPSTFVVHASGDNRYKLYVNEQLVSLGPARG